ncbi:MAG: serine/threonine protein kinase [Cyanobacteria bacterium SID2]|nr:serine/threonine protein kinase [Cyanobacteria bacterium SID2]MBP0006649.1 serine/threonine protein kinase [Cyanobacteria bacterium SBC]
MLDRILKGRYEIQKQLGKRVGQQTVLALDRQTQNRVVIKLLTFGGGLTWETFKLFEREAQTLKHLEHSAIPRYLDYFEIETKFGKGFALVQSYIDAPSLEEHTQVGRTFSETELKQIAKAVLAICNYLHTRHPIVIHRDIKPGNILLKDRSGNSVGRVYLVDFGSVRATAFDRGTMTVVGTYGYMPPEQFGGRAVPASDLYGLGATLIYLASGRHPADLPQADLRIDFESHVNLSPSFIDWLKWMTEPSLDRRLPSASRALKALENPTQAQSTALALSQPAGSKIQLTKSREALEIMIPPKGWCLELIPLIGFAILWNGFLVMWYSVAISTWSSGGWFAAFFALGHLGVGFWLIFYILSILFRETYLSVDLNKISLKHKLFNIFYRQVSPAPRQQIVKLEIKLEKGSLQRKGNTQLKPQINIWAGTKKFAIGGGGVVSEIELEWLARELSDWLELSLHDYR